MPTMSFSGKKADAPSQPNASESAEPASVANGGLQREPAQAAAEQKPDSTVAVRPESQLGRPIDPGFAGHWDASDIRLPRINLIHKTSADNLIEKFGIGGFAFGKEVKLGDGKKPIFIVALRAAKDYVQKLPFGDPEQPAVFKTPEEVERNGGTLNWSDQEGNNLFVPRAHIQIATPLPEGASEEDSALFPYEYNDKPWGMAIFTVSSSAYTSVGKEIATLCTNNKVMRKGMINGALNLTSEIRKNAKNSWHVPVIKYTGANPPELVTFLQSLVSE